MQWPSSLARPRSGQQSVPFPKIVETIFGSWSRTASTDEITLSNPVLPRSFDNHEKVLIAESFGAHPERLVARRDRDFLRGASAGT